MVMNILYSWRIINHYIGIGNTWQHHHAEFSMLRGNDKFVFVSDTTLPVGAHSKARCTANCQFLARRNRLVGGFRISRILLSLFLLSDRLSEVKPFKTIQRQLTSDDACWAQSNGYMIAFVTQLFQGAASHCKLSSDSQQIALDFLLTSSYSCGFASLDAQTIFWCVLQ